MIIYKIEFYCVRLFSSLQMSRVSVEKRTDDGKWAMSWLMTVVLLTAANYPPVLMALNHHFPDVHIGFFGVYFSKQVFGTKTDNYRCFI